MLKDLRKETKEHVGSNLLQAINGDLSFTRSNNKGIVYGTEIGKVNKGSNTTTIVGHVSD